MQYTHSALLDVGPDTMKSHAQISTLGAFTWQSDVLKLDETTLGLGERMCW